jgi:hypothetical protein
MNLPEMTRDTAEAIEEAFTRTYRLTSDGTFVNKVGRAAPDRSLELYWQAFGVLAKAV